MMKNHKLAGAIQDVNWGEFKVMLNYKAQWYGREIIEISRWFPSSKTCSVCGYIKKDLTLKDRELECPECGEIHNRDVNAAINIREEGLRLIGCRTPEFTLGDCPTMDDRLNKIEVLKSSGKLNLEEIVKEVAWYATNFNTFRIGWGFILWLFTFSINEW